MRLCFLFLLFWIVKEFFEIISMEKMSKLSFTKRFTKLKKDTCTKRFALTLKQAFKYIAYSTKIKEIIEQLDAVRMY